MFDILWTEIHNFKSYRGKHRFEFPTEPGLFYLTGDNQDNPRLEANGAGKSTLLDAIYWCLYGRTSRGLKAGDVITWGEKSCTVTVALAIGDSELVIRRSQSPNSLTVKVDGGTPETVEQDMLQRRYLRLNPQAFEHSILMPQFGEAFFDLGAGAKLNLFSAIMDLDFWLEKSAEADKLAKELKADIEAQERSIAKYLGQIETLDADIETLTAQQARFDSERADTIRGLRDDLAEAELELERTTQDVPGHEGAVAEAGKKLAAALKHKDQLCDAVARCRAELRTASNDVAAANARMRDIQADIARISGLRGACSECGQEIDASHVKRQLRARDRALDELEEQHRYLLGIEKSRERALTRALADEKATAANVQDCTDLKRDLLRLQDAAKAQSDRAEQAVKALEAKIRAAKAQTNPYSALLAAKVTTLAASQKALSGARKAVEQLHEDHAAVSHWVPGFKRVRLFLVDRALRQLELEVNSSLSSLGLTDWRVEFDIERENKSGGVTKGFVTLVWAPGAPGPVKLEAWSGGETQRLRLAGNLGLSNLIMERAGLTSRIEFYDEFSAHMTDGGVHDMLDTLHARAIATGRSIWVVDHRIVDYADFAGVLTATKTSEGSQLQYEALV